MVTYSGNGQEVLLATAQKKTFERNCNDIWFYIIAIHYELNHDLKCWWVNLNTCPLSTCSWKCDSAGACFAANQVPWSWKRKLHLVRNEGRKITSYANSGVICSRSIANRLTVSSKCHQRSWKWFCIFFVPDDFSCALLKRILFWLLTLQQEMGQKLEDLHGNNESDKRPM